MLYSKDDKIKHFLDAINRLAERYHDGRPFSVEDSALMRSYESELEKLGKPVTNVDEPDNTHPKFFVARLRFKNGISHPWTFWAKDLDLAFDRTVDIAEGSQIRSVTIVNRPSHDAEFFAHHEANTRNLALEHPEIEWRHDWE